MISRRTLAKALANRHLIGTAVIRRRALTRDSLGGQTEVWTDDAAIPALLEVLTQRPSEQEGAANRLTSAVQYRLYVAVEVAITAADRVVSNGRVFEVSGDPAIDDVSALLTVPLQEIG